MAVTATTETGARPARAGRRPAVPSWAGTVPFFAYVTVFLLWPTAIVVVDSFKNSAGGWAFANVTKLGDPLVRGYFIGSFKLCVLSSVIGAVFGAILAYAIASGNPDGAVRRLYLAGSIAGFTTGSIQLFQVVFAHAANNAIPWTRAHVYGVEKAPGVVSDSRTANAALGNDCRPHFDKRGAAT